MIKKIIEIHNLAVFKDFEWNKNVIATSNKAGNKPRPEVFKKLNILYGRNYSGKTSLSRIFRSFETGVISDKYDNPTYKLMLENKKELTEKDIDNNELNIRVFNEDFVKDNLRFIVNPDNDIEPFAILGESNNEILERIKQIDTLLGSNQIGNETGLYKEQANAIESYESSLSEFNIKKKELSSLIAKKAIDKKNGIKYNSSRFGDQNYNTTKLEKEIEYILTDDYVVPDKEKIVELEGDIKEEAKDLILEKEWERTIDWQSIKSKVDEILTRDVTGTKKIAELLNDTKLNEWTKRGVELHDENHKKCLFCENNIDHNRWQDLVNHFDQSFRKLEEDIHSLISEIDIELNNLDTLLTINKTLFYRPFYDELNKLEQQHIDFSNKYRDSLNEINQALSKKLLDFKVVSLPVLNLSFDDELKFILNNYKKIIENSNSYSKDLETKIKESQKSIRLLEIFKFSSLISYSDCKEKIEKFKENTDKREEDLEKIQMKISRLKKDKLDEQKKTHDESNGARKVNEYLTNYFGHGYLKLEAIENSENEGVSFQIKRDNKKAYHLSEGEQSLISFCYFMAKLEDIKTKGEKPIIWIDDPISSLDGNHIFFVFSIIDSEITKKDNYDQLFVSTHNLDFLKYLKRLTGNDKEYFTISRCDDSSRIEIMPKYMKEYFTEFNYLFKEIYDCSKINSVDDNNFKTFYNFANNARKFLEIYLFYKYPDYSGTNDDVLKLEKFFGKDTLPTILIQRVNNEYSHLKGVLERGGLIIEQPEMQKVAQLIVATLKEKDPEQFRSLLNSIGCSDEE